ARQIVIPVKVLISVMADIKSGIGHQVTAQFVADRGMAGVGDISSGSILCRVVNGTGGTESDSRKRRDRPVEVGFPDNCAYGIKGRIVVALVVITRLEIKCDQIGKGQAHTKNRLQTI